MNRDAISAIAEAIGVLAVVASLIYLATQVSFAKLAAADLSRQTRANGVRENLREISNNHELRRNWLESSKLNSAYEKWETSLGLSADAAMQVDFMCQSWMWLHWGQYSSITTKSDLEELRHVVGMSYSVPPMSICWAQGPYEKELLEEKFVSFVEQAVAECGSSRSSEDAN